MKWNMRKKTTKEVVATVARYMKVCMLIPSLLHLLACGHEGVRPWGYEDVRVLWYDLISPPPSLSLLLHACQAVLNPGASRSCIPSHHTENIFLGGDENGNHVKNDNGIAKKKSYILVLRLCMFHPIMANMQEWLKLTTFWSHTGEQRGQRAKAPVVGN